MVPKPLDNPTRGVGASCSGRNESEREVAPKVSSPGGRARNREGEGSMTRCKPIDRAGHSGGVVSDGTTTRTHRATGEALLVQVGPGDVVEVVASSSCQGFDPPSPRLRELAWL